MEYTYGDFPADSEINAANNEIIYVDSQRIVKYMHNGETLWYLHSSYSIYPLTSEGWVQFAEPL